MKLFCTTLRHAGTVDTWTSRTSDNKYDKQYQSNCSYIKGACDCILFGMQATAPEIFSVRHARVFVPQCNLWSITRKYICVVEYCANWFLKLWGSDQCFRVVGVRTSKSFTAFPESNPGYEPLFPTQSVKYQTKLYWKLYNDLSVNGTLLIILGIFIELNFLQNLHTTINVHTLMCLRVYTRAALIY